MASKLFAVVSLSTVAAAHQGFNILESIERTGHGNLLDLDNGIHCVEDVHCCSDCQCVVDPFNRTSFCKHFGLHDLKQNQEDYENAEQAENTERGEFEIGYWCLKHTDCATKKCAQVGPRKYDKECQEKNFIDFVVTEKKEKKKHHRREEEPAREELVE